MNSEKGENAALIEQLADSEATLEGLEECYITVVQQTSKATQNALRMQLSNEALRKQLDDHNNTTSQLESARAEIQRLETCLEAVPKLETQIVDLNKQLEVSRGKTRAEQQTVAGLVKQLEVAEAQIAKLEISGVRSVWEPRYYQCIRKFDHEMDEQAAKQAANYWYLTCTAYCTLTLLGALPANACHQCHVLHHMMSAAADPLSSVVWCRTEPDGEVA